MKKTLLYCILMLSAVFCGTAAMAQSVAGGTPRQALIDGVSVSDMKLERNGRFLSVDMLLNLSDLKVSRNRAVLLTPRLVNGKDSVNLPAVGVYGRQRYYFYVRNGESLLSGKDETSFKASGKPASLAYSKVVPYQEWMNGASLILHRSDYGCCNTLLAGQDAMLGRHSEPKEFFPELVFVRPKAELDKKRRSRKGSAFIDFPVDQTVIYPDYRRNVAELAKIKATIDSVRDDSDVTITRVELKGFASPESPYSHNRELAIGRTEALKNYITQLYHFDNSVIVTYYEPEDWAGLRRFVMQSDISHKDDILAIIDSNLDPDKKEAKIKSAYPAEYRLMLRDFYPALRHTDYLIIYEIRSYSEVEEIERIMHTRPQNLSLNEFYIVAQEYEPGSEKFSEVFETAVRMFPDDKIANLNAANAAMRRGDNSAAKRYLEKAGDSPEAVYARGALAVRLGDYVTARSYLEKAGEMGVEEASVTLRELEDK